MFKCVCCATLLAGAARHAPAGCCPPAPPPLPAAVIGKRSVTCSSSRASTGVQTSRPRRLCAFASCSTCSTWRPTERRETSNGFVGLRCVGLAHARRQLQPGSRGREAWAAASTRSATHHSSHRRCRAPSPRRLSNHSPRARPLRRPTLPSASPMACTSRGRWAAQRCKEGGRGGADGYRRRDNGRAQRAQPLHGRASRGAASRWAGTADRRAGVAAACRPCVGGRSRRSDCGRDGLAEAGMWGCRWEGARAVASRSSF